MDLKGTFFLVTGGAHRVGKAIAEALAEEGAHVAITYRASAGPAHETVQGLQSRGVRALAVPCDQSDPVQVERAFQTVLAEFGRLDGLVNSASIMQEVSFLQATLQDWDASLNINLRGPFLFSQAAGGWMLEHGGGTIINIIDESAVSPTRHFVLHGVSKSGLWMLTRSSALALAPAVRVNAVLPGPVLIPQDWPEERWQRLADSTPLRRLGSPQDVARAVVYLAREEYITGQMVVVDGGRTLVG